MKTKKNANKKFNLEKIEIAKLSQSQMKSIIGGIGDNEPKTTTDSVIPGNGGPILH